MSDTERIYYGAWLQSFQGLAWRFNYAQSSLVALNDWQHPSLGSNTERLLKDSSFRSQFLSANDLSLFKEFWDVLGAGLPATIMFTVQKDYKTQFLLHGWTDSESKTIFGYLQLAPPVYTEEHSVSTMSSLLFRASYPVFVMSHKNNAITAINASALKLFGYAEQDSCEKSSARNLFTAASYKMMQKWTSKNFEGTWAGSLSFKDANGKVFLSQVRVSIQKSQPIKALSNANDGHIDTQSPERLLRFVFLEFRLQKPCVQDENMSDTLLASVNDSKSLYDALSCILAAVPEADGIIFSDINARKGKVCVYAVGPNFATMPWGQNYPYEGTIAQVIEHHNHSYLIVNNTKDSIKVIDWALFIPYGVQSYFAKAFFFRGRLHAVLIFTSNKVNTFAHCNQTGKNSFQHIDAAFTSAIQRWRQENTRH